MSSVPSESPAPSPSKHSSSSGGSAFKSKIAAFESGLAANASKRDQAKHIPHADLSNLRSRFDREGEKPLEVKGSFGLGAAPPASSGTRAGNLGGSGRDGHRAVSLGIGRAVSPMQSPSVIVPGAVPGTGIRSASSTTVNSTGSGNAESRTLPTSSSRPHIPRSDSTNSNSTSATSTSISGATATSTASSLLPAPLAALRASSNSTAHSNSPYGGDDSTSTGLRTPMSSISLSSLHVEAGSVAGDVASSSGETTANEDETAGSVKLEDTASTPHDEKAQVALTSVSEEFSDLHKDSLQPSAATADAQEPPQEAVERAAEELDKYTLEEPSTTAVISPPPEETALPPSISLTQLAPSAPQDDADAAESDRLPTSPPPISSAFKSPSRRTSSSAFSPQDRLKRSSTANSIASHPESDLADTNLESFDAQNDTGKAKKLAGIKIPSPTRDTNFGESPSTPSRSKVNAAPTSGKTSPLDALLAEKQDFLPVDVADEENETDEDGMPLVKCSDCGARVSLVQLGEHVCAASTPAASKIAFPTSSGANNISPSSLSFRDRRETGPEDVPKGALSPETVGSPNMSHRSITSSRPDVPDDEASSVASINAGLEDTHINDDEQNSPARHGKLTSVPVDTEETEEDYMTALTSHRDSIDPTNAQRPDFSTANDNDSYGSSISNLPESISDPRLYNNNITQNDEDDETEELAIGMADQPADTPRMASFGTARQLYPDSPTPEPRQLPIANGTSSTSEKLATPSHDFGGAPGVRRRSSAGRRNKALGDTDSEGEIEPGTATIIR